MRGVAERSEGRGESVRRCGSCRFSTVIANQSADWCGDRRECLWCNPFPFVLRTRPFRGGHLIRPGFRRATFSLRRRLWCVPCRRGGHRPSAFAEGAVHGNLLSVGEALVHRTGRRPKVLDNCQYSRPEIASGGTPQPFPAGEGFFVSKLGAGRLLLFWALCIKMYVCI